MRFSSPITGNGLIFDRQDAYKEQQETESAGGFFGIARQIVRTDILARDYRRIDKRQGKRTAEVTPRKIMEAIPKPIVKEQISELAETLGSRKTAREAIASRLQIEITRAKEERVEQLNRETMAMILTAIMADE